MRPSDSVLENQVRSFCAAIGRDPLLVQGAGGNVSWKEADILWVKASGTWLADSERSDIFVPVDLHKTRAAIQEGRLDDPAPLATSSALKPSIETLLHALMPQRIVVHLHAIEVLAHLVRHAPEQVIASQLDKAVHWASVDYFKPGAELAAAVVHALMAQPDADVIFLRNHGVVIGADSIDGILDRLHLVTAALKNELLSTPPGHSTAPDTCALEQVGYRLSDRPELNALANCDDLHARLKPEWALYPDHVVFLGARAVVLEDDQAILGFCKSDARPPYVFVPGSGVYGSNAVTPSHEAQLHCYANVLVRQRPTDRLRPLTDAQIASLLNWDAEKYRQQLARDAMTVA